MTSESAGSMTKGLPLGNIEELYERAPCGYVFTLPDGRFVHVNETFAAWLGYTPQELTSSERRLQDLLTTPGKLFYENQFAPLLAMQGSIREIALDLLRRDGQTLPCLLNAVQLDADDHRPELIAAVVFDATERRRYERELVAMRRRAEELASVINAVQDAILSVSPTGTVETYNDGARRLFASYQGELNERPLDEILRLSERPAESRAIWSRVQQGQVVQCDAIAVTDRGEEVDVSASLSPYLSERGVLTSVACVLTDNRERKRLERMQRDYLATASHELRNPITVLKGQLQFMRRRGELGPESSEALLDQVSQLERLVEELHVANEMQLEHIELRWETVDLVREAAHFSQLAIEDHPVSVEASVDSLLVPADPTRLRQVMANLLSNAAKYSPPESPIEVTVREEGHLALLSVTDHGAGIPEAEQPYLFDRFFRAAGASRTKQGLGLGLFVSRRIIEAHGGDILVQSRPGEGSTFTIRIPTDRVATPS